MDKNPTQSSGPILDADGRVITDAICVQCGYNLRTLSADALCPECAHPVAHSIHGHIIQFASPAWVRGLARGLLLILIAAGSLMIAVPLISFIIGIVLAARSPQSLASPTGFMRTYAAIQQTIGILVVGLGVIGIVFVTRPDPSEPDPAPGHLARRITRYGALLLPVLLVVHLVVSLIYIPNMATPGMGGLFTATTTIAAIVGLALVLVYLVTALGLLRVLMHLMRRIPRLGLVRFAQILFWVLLPSSAVTMIGYAVVFLQLAPTMRAMAAAMPTTMPATTQPALAANPPTITTTSIPPAGGSFRITGGVTTSAPATVPPTRAFAGILVGAGVAMIGGCAATIAGLAYVVLMIIACVALFRTAREAEQNAAIPVATLISPSDQAPESRGLP